MSKNTPVFVHHGVDATCCSTLFMDAREFLFVGTSQGKSQLCDILSYQFKETVYEDAEKRSIVGVNARLNENIIETFVHVRDFAVVVLSKNEKEWVQKKVIPVGHYGFCSFKLTSTSILLPDVENSNNIIRVIWDSGRTDRIALGDKGIPLCLNTFESSVLIGDEAGTLTVTENGFMRKKSLYSEPIFDLAISKSGLIAVGSTLPPIKCLRINNFNDEDIISLDYRPDASGCGSLVFLPSEKTLLAGYWDDFHKQTITNLCWFENNQNEMLEKDQMVSCSKDGTICFWKFPKV